MARTGKFLSGVPKGWCAKRPDVGRVKEAGVRVSEVHPDSMRNVFYKKFPARKMPKNASRGASMGVTYGCVGKWKSKGPVKSRCQGSMRVVRLMKPTARVRTSKHRRDYECRKEK